MSGKLIMTVGLPASGKSSWAAEQNGAIVVTKDDIRAELNKPWNYDVEKEVFRIRDFRICQALSKGYVVISADTNLAPKHGARLRDLAKKYKATFEVKSFLDIPLLECIKRDSLREEGKVGEKVIVKMAEEFLNPAELLERTAFIGEPQLFLDLDGVFADFDGFISKEFGIEGNREKERDDFWDIVRGYTGRLYYDMDRLPRAAELYAALVPYRPIILTGCPWSIANAALDKREWVAEELDPDVQVICCRSRNKCLYGRPGDILLDDWNKYETRWTGMGGKFLLHKDVDESIKMVKEALGG